MATPTSGYFKSIDPFNLALWMSELLRQPEISVTGSVNRGELFGQISRNLHQKILSCSNKLVIAKHVLSRSEAQTHKQIFAKKSESEQIPWILGPASLIPVVGAAITIATSSVDGLMRMAQGKVSAAQFAVLMAEGGTFFRVLSIDSAADLLTSSAMYAVDVGKEPRVYGICSATWRLRVV